jgi:preprotein translocase subunit SecG
MGTFAYYAVLSLLITVAVLLILLILIQKGRGGGLSSAFGGGGGSSAFGAKTGDVLTWATSIIFGIFILLAVSLDLLVEHQYATPTQAFNPAAQTLNDAIKQLQKQLPPAATTSASAADQPNPQGGYTGSTTLNPGNLKPANSLDQLIKNPTTQAVDTGKAATQKAMNTLSPTTKP